MMIDDRDSQRPLAANSYGPLGDLKEKTDRLLDEVAQRIKELQEMVVKGWGWQRQPARNPKADQRPPG